MFNSLNSQKKRIGSESSKARKKRIRYLLIRQRITAPEFKSGKPSSTFLISIAIHNSSVFPWFPPMRFNCDSFSVDWKYEWWRWLWTQIGFSDAGYAKSSMNIWIFKLRRWKFEDVYWERSMLLKVSCLEFGALTWILVC